MNTLDSLAGPRFSYSVHGSINKCQKVATRLCAALKSPAPTFLHASCFSLYNENSSIPSLIPQFGAYLSHLFFPIIKQM